MNIPLLILVVLCAHVIGRAIDAERTAWGVRFSGVVAIVVLALTVGWMR